MMGAPGSLAGRIPRWFRPGWPLYLSLALLFGLYQGTNQIVDLRRNGSQITFWKPLLWETSSVLVIVALIPLIVRFESRFRIDGRPRWRSLAAHLGAALAFSGAHTVGMVTLRKLAYALAGDRYDSGNWLTTAFYELQKDLITYLVILVVILAIREVRVRRAGELRAAELAAQLSEARLLHLTAQIEPHFLFNSLNAISNRMHENVDAADRMISYLGDLLRAAYDSDSQVLVPLQRELDWLRGYAAMMTERFRGQLSFELEVAPGLAAERVPRLLLQPIVENALTHGLGDGYGSLRVDVRRSGSRLSYTISDDGVGLQGKTVKRGTGLSNVTRRLELLFPGDHTFTLVPREPRGTVVALSFPVAD